MAKRIKKEQYKLGIIKSGFKKGYTPWNKGKKPPQEQITRFIERLKGNKYGVGLKFSEKELKRRSDVMKGNKINLGRKYTEEYKSKILKASLKGLFKKRPTSLEIQMIKIIQKYKLPYKYTGDGEVLIGFKNPDFVNTNGEKICIDVRHPKINEVFYKISKEEYVQQRVNHFAKYGWRCIVFVTDKLNEDGIIALIKKYLEKMKK